MTAIPTIVKPFTNMLQVFESLPEGTLAQLIQNQLHMSPAPSFTHQNIVMRLSGKIYAFLEKNDIGLVLTAPFDVYLDARNVFQPDIIFISHAKKQLIQENGLHGAPDMVVEVLSIHNARHDLVEKMDVYARRGVQEYWIVEPHEKLAKGYHLQDNRDEYTLFFEGTGVLNSQVLGKRFRF